MIPEHKKPGQIIKSEEWNKILDELVDLRRYIDNKTRNVTLTSLISSVNVPRNLFTDAPNEFNYGIDVIGLITKQYYSNKIGPICKFGIHDFFDIIYYWSGAKGDSESIMINMEYTDGTSFKSDKLLVHGWTKLRDRGDKNPFIEWLISPNQRVWYKYGLKNPNPDREVRYILFESINTDNSVRIADTIQYTTRLKSINYRWK